MSPHDERVRQALDLLTEGLYPFVERELKAVYGDKWHEIAGQSFRKSHNKSIPNGEVVQWDAQTLLTILWDQWNNVFRGKLGHMERSIVSELREFRNQWAHQREFDFDDTYRILDSVQRLLTAVSSPAVEEIAREKHELMRSEFVRREDFETRQQEFKKKKWRTFAVYVACCILLVGAVLTAFGWQAWYVAGAIVFAFAYFIWQLVTTKPQLFGPHECDRCGRIIYMEPCPYCTTAQTEARLPPEVVREGPR